MPKVLRILNRFNLGGPTYNASYLTRYLAPEFKTLLIGGRAGENEEDSLFIPQSLGLEPLILENLKREISPYNDYKAYREIKKIIQEFKPDIVHTHASKAGALGRKAAHEAGIPAIVHTFHGHVFDSYFNGLISKYYVGVERRLARKSHAIIALSQNQKYDLLQRFSICEEEKLHIIPLGFDLNRFAENKKHKRKFLRDKYNIGEDEIVVTIVGRVVPIKNHDLFLNVAFRILKKTGKKVRFLIVGDGELLPGLLEKVKDAGYLYSYKERKPKTPFIFTSWMKEVDEILAGSDIVALSSLNEGTPVSLIEAQAAGKAIITTEVGGVKDIVQEGKTAILVPSADEDAFFEGLLRLIDDQYLCSEMSENGGNYAFERFHYQRMVDEMRILYNKLLRK